MAWAIIPIYTSKCAQMDPQKLPTRSKFYSRCKRCDADKTYGGVYHPLGSLKVKNVLRSHWLICFTETIMFSFTCHSYSTEFDLYSFHCRTVRSVQKKCCPAAALVAGETPIYMKMSMIVKIYRWNGGSMRNSVCRAFELFK